MVMVMDRQSPIFACIYMNRMSEIGTELEQAAPLAKPMPALMSSFAIREDSRSTVRQMCI